VLVPIFQMYSILAKGLYLDVRLRHGVMIKKIRIQTFSKLSIRSRLPSGLLSFKPKRCMRVSSSRTCYFPTQLYLPWTTPDRHIVTFVFVCVAVLYTVGEQRHSEQHAAVPTSDTVCAHKLRVPEIHGQQGRLNSLSHE
jgi:hypothetical protein